MDLHLIPYGIIATGHEKGVIEVVQNAKTVAKVATLLLPMITLLYDTCRYKHSMEVSCLRLKRILFTNGYERKILGKTDSWLITTMMCVVLFSDEDMDKAKQTFMLSCAGYCVATYVLVSLSICVHVLVTCSVITGYWGQTQ